MGDVPTPTVQSGNSGSTLPNFDGRPVSINGFEDHSVNVTGNDEIATYDDSNVFINRNGPINANTGDTDSSGLNAVDVTDSTVKSGASTDGSDGDDGTDDNAGPLSATALPAAGANHHDTASVVDDDSATSAAGSDPLAIGGDIEAGASS